MNTQIVAKIETIENELEELKSLLKEESKMKSSKKGGLSGVRKGFKRKGVEVSIAEGLRDYRKGKVYGPFNNMGEFKASLKNDS